MLLNYEKLMKWENWKKCNGINLEVYIFQGWQMIIKDSI